MMEIILLILMLTGVSASVFPSLDHIRPSASADDQHLAVKDLFKRVLGPGSSSFDVEIIVNKDPEFRETFNLISDGSNVTITATSGVSAAMGFYYFLKTKCGCQFTWAGEQLNLPSPLPVIGKPGLSVTTNDRFRYYQNVCTSSYSFVWWNWKQWQRHIDWMAMNGINLPLAFTGQEAIFQKVFRKLGFTEEDLKHHFPGPAFLVWGRMGNIQGWGGPLPQSWIDDQLALQHKILGRMRELGMTPVLPGFPGYVPDAITRLYPNVKVSRLDNWKRFNKTYCCSSLLDFQEPLFKEIGSAFIQEMQSEFGVDHIYSADTFNEMIPSSSEIGYIKSAGQAVYNAMTAGDPDAVWLMQGWLFDKDKSFWLPPQTKALLTSVPKGRMIVLDLFAERTPVYNVTESFYGQPFIWGMLQNFGGTMRLYGMIDAVNEGPFVARNFAGSTMIGIGITSEGIHQNEPIYELMNENAYAKSPRNLTKWFSDYHMSRYGAYNQDAEMAWQLLKSSVYNYSNIIADDTGNVIPTSRPSLALHLSVSHKAKICREWYDPEQLNKACGHMVDASKVHNNSELFRYDLVDVTRNSLQHLSIKFYKETLTAYDKKDVDQLQIAGNSLVQILNDMEMLLGSDVHFLLGPWIRDARKHGHTVTEQNLMEYNARNQITLWGPNGENRDYATKQWSGLISRYYAPRWQRLVGTLIQSLERGEPFNQTSYDIEMFETVEKPFTFDTSDVPVEPKGDSVKIASDLYQKYFATMPSDCDRQPEDRPAQNLIKYEL